VAGKLQKSGRAAAAKVVRTEFTDEADTVVLDLRAAYAVDGLDQLRRTFVFSRGGRGRLTVTDEVRFAAPESFATALVTLSEWRKAGSNALVVGSGPGTVRVEIDAGGAQLTVDAERIEEDLPGPKLPTRLGINLAEPVAQARVTLVITPQGE
jgi:hypothetical protein